MSSFVALLRPSQIQEDKAELDITQSCRKKYPNMIPIKIQCEEGIKINKKKFLISENTTGLELERHILNYTERQIGQGLYYFIIDNKKHRMLQTNVLIKEPYNLYKNKDGYLQLLVIRQNMF